MDWYESLTAAHWLGLGLVLLALEVGAGIAYLLGAGLGALLVALVLLFMPLTPALQIVLFVLGSIAATFAYARLFRNEDEYKAADGMHDRLGSMVGKETSLAEPVHGNDRIPFGDTLWRVRSAEPIAAGQKVRVVDVDNDVLVIEAL